jgi:5-formyltetrahydrofolate cyclo-ligase
VAEQLTGASPKAVLRREVLAARDALALEARGAASAKIMQALLALEAWKTARRVLAYLSFGSEFDTAALIADAAKYGKQLCVPRVDRAARSLVVHTVDDIARDTVAGTWGIREPQPDRPVVDVDTIEFVLVPGVAFTPQCERLGYGGGYYDGLIARFAMRPPLVAAAFALQMRATIPLSPRDRTVDLVITETRSYCGC